MRRGKLDNDPLLQFPARDPELKFASIRFRLPDGTTYTAEFFHRVLFLYQIENAGHDDPLRECRRTDHESAVGSAKLSGWVKEWEELFGVEGANLPLDETSRNRRLASVSAELPEDYLFLVSQSEGLSAGDCAVLGLSEIYEIVLEERSYYVLAQLDGNGLLAVRRSTQDRGTYYLDYSDSNLVKKVAGFREAVESYLKDPEHWLEGSRGEN